MNSAELGKVAHAEHIFAEVLRDRCEVLKAAGCTAWACLQHHAFANVPDSEWWRTSLHNSLSGTLPACKGVGTSGTSLFCAGAGHQNNRCARSFRKPILPVLG